MGKTFVRVHSIKDIVISVSLLVLGSILVAIPALVLKTGYKDVETAAKYHKKEKYFQQTIHTAVANVIASKLDLVN